MWTSNSDRVNLGPGVNKDVRGQQGQTEIRWVSDENHQEWYTTDFECVIVGPSALSCMNWDTAGVQSSKLKPFIIFIHLDTFLNVNPLLYIAELCSM